MIHPVFIGIIIILVLVVLREIFRRLEENKKYIQRLNTLAGGFYHIQDPDRPICQVCVVADQHPFTYCGVHQDE